MALKMSAVHYEARHHTSPDSMWAAASYVAKEYGSHGYSLGIAAGGFSVTVFEVRHFDGSSFNVVADRWGNVDRIPDDVSADDACDFVQAMSRKACEV